MSPTHLAAALLIVAMWGLNFTVIRFGLDEFLRGHERVGGLPALLRVVLFWRDLSAPRAVRRRFQPRANTMPATAIEKNSSAVCTAR